MEVSRTRARDGFRYLAAAIFVAVDLAAEQRAARGAEHGAEQLVTAAGDFMAGEAAHRTADQEAGGAILLLPALTAIIVPPDSGCAFDTLGQRIMPVALTLAVQVQLGRGASR